jgi:hypothetical protein
MAPEWWLTGNDCVVAACVEDEMGPVFYFRVDKENELARLHVQFAPEAEVSKKRLITALLESIPKLAEAMSKQGFKGIVYESISESLIKFGSSQLGFCPLSGNDYILRFEVAA